MIPVSFQNQVQILNLRPDLAESARVRQHLRAVAGRMGFSEERVFDIQVAVGEAVANAIEHTGGIGDVKVELKSFADRLEVSVSGPGDFHLPERGGAREHRGLGLPLMATLCDHLALYSAADGGTLVTLSFHLPQGAHVRSDVPPWESEQRFRALLKATSEVLYRMSPDWGEMRQLDSEGFLANPDAPTGSWLEKYIHPQDRPRVNTAIKEAIRTKSVFELEHRVRRADGTLGWTFSRAVPVLDAHGEIVEWFGSATDVTERRRTEEDLRESEERYRTLFDHMTEGFALGEVMVDEEGEPYDFRFVEVNAAFEQQTGLGREVLGQPITTVLTELERDWIDAYTTVALTGEPKRFTRYNRDTDRYYEVFCYSPALGRFAIIFSDVSERVRSEQELSRFFALSPDILAIASVDDGRWKRVNRAFTEILGWTEEEARSMPFFDILHPDDVARFRQAIEEVAEGARLIRFEQRVRSRNGSYRWVTWDAHGDEQAGLLYLAGRDMTERRRAEEERRRVAAELAGKRRELGAALEREDLLATLLDSSSQPFAALNEEGRLILFNLAFQGLSGYSEEELLGEVRWSEGLIAPELREEEASVLRRVRRTGEPQLHEKELVRKDGTRVPVAILVHLGQRTEGEPFYYSFVSDISRRKRAEEERERLIRENARLYETQKKIADTLQDALLRPVVDLAGLDSDFVYRSATEAAFVGGDFLDLFRIDKDHVGFAIGDVCGHGVEAATMASLVRDTLRAYAFQKLPPDQVLGLANTALRRQTALGEFTTVLFATLNCSSGQVAYSSAGHPPPLLRRTSGEVERLETDFGAPLGAFSGSGYRSAQKKLNTGDTILLYTDGVIEARRNGSLFGEERLAEAFRLGGSKMEGLAEGLLESVIEFSGGRLGDDLAMLAVRRKPGKKRSRLPRVRDWS